MFSRFWWRFRPVKGYSDYGVNYRIKYRGFEYGYGIFADVIFREMTLRALVQRYDTVKLKCGHSLTTIDDKLSMQALEEELNNIQHEIVSLRGDLYESEQFLPTRPLKKMYDSLREDVLWFIRPELVQDCKERRGCCSRGCGCCQSRLLTKRAMGGLGHCTIECSCCIEFRGFNPTREEREAVAKKYKEMLSSANPAFLLRMIEAYFSKPAWSTRIQGVRRGSDASHWA